jgi:hypothetical protein
MSKKNIFAAVGGALLGLGLACQGWADECFPVSGKIFNNAIGDNTPGTVSTIGTVHFVAGEGTTAEKFKCGLMGVAIERANGDVHYRGDLNYVHTMSCDDNEGSSSAPVYSLATWDTSGYYTGVVDECDGFQSVTFHEESWLVPAGASGIFQGATSGHLSVDGMLYCTLAIKMKLSGEVCYPDLP